MRELRRGPDAYRADEWILGQTAFVEQLRAEAEAVLTAHAHYAGSPWTASCKESARPSASRPAPAGGGRTAPVSRAREGIAYLWTTVLGQAGRPLTATLGVPAQSIYGAAAHGRAARPR